MKTLPIVEIFGHKEGVNAIQGEGMFAGVPSIFIRLFGCNLRCEFGMRNWTQEEKDSTISYIKNSKADTLDDLPIYKVFCDSYYSILPEFRKFSKEMTPEEIADEVGFTREIGYTKPHIVITGGEPLITGYQDLLIELIEKLKCKGYDTFTIETNTTYKLTDRFKTLLNSSSCYIFFSMSPKMKDSCVSRSEAWIEGVANDYMRYAPGWFKFVVANEMDVYEVFEYLHDMMVEHGSVPVYLMPSGATQEELDKTQNIVYNLCCEFGLRYSPRLHVTVGGGGIGV